MKPLTPVSGSDAPADVQSRLEILHNRIHSRLDELRKDFKQLHRDLRAADQDSARARKDRREGFKQALRDLLTSADKADREWR